MEAAVLRLGMSLRQMEALVSDQTFDLWIAAMNVAAIVGRSDRDSRVQIAKSFIQAQKTPTALVLDRGTLEQVPWESVVETASEPCPFDPFAVGLLLAVLQKHITAQTTCDWQNLQTVIAAVIARLDLIDCDTREPA